MGAASAKATRVASSLGKPVIKSDVIKGIIQQAPVVAPDANAADALKVAFHSVYAAADAIPLLLPAPLCVLLHHRPRMQALTRTPAAGQASTQHRRHPLWPTVSTARASPSSAPPASCLTVWSTANQTSRSGPPRTSSSSPKCKRWVDGIMRVFRTLLCFVSGRERSEYLTVLYVAA